MYFDDGESCKIVGSREGVKLNQFTYLSTVCDMEMDVSFD